MKEILLLRHAKSSWDYQDLQDFERPLSKRGLRDAPMMGSYLRKISHKPDEVVASTAQRAKETIQLVMKGMKENEDSIQWNKDLYFGSMQDYLTSIQSANSKSNRIMIVGHNPTIENTAGALAGNDRTTGIRMPTAALVCLQTYANSWDSIQWGTCELKWMMIPKVLKQIS